MSGAERTSRANGHVCDRRVETHLSTLLTSSGRSHPSVSLLSLFALLLLLSHTGPSAASELRMCGPAPRLGWQLGVFL